MVGVAQVVERQIVVLNVAGSSPVTHPTQNRHASLDIVHAYRPLGFEKTLVLTKILWDPTDRGVAQLVAHSLWERGVAGSNPAAPTILRSARFALVASDGGPFF